MLNKLRKGKFCRNVVAGFHQSCLEVLVEGRGAELALKNKQC